MHNLYYPLVMIIYKAATEHHTSICYENTHISQISAYSHPLESFHKVYYNSRSKFATDSSIWFSVYSHKSCYDSIPTSITPSQTSILTYRIQIYSDPITFHTSSYLYQTKTKYPLQACSLTDQLCQNSTQQMKLVQSL